LSIQYAEPPIGELRLAKSIPLQKQAEGIFYANQWPKACVELEGFGHISDH
jgi:carboxylesterase